MYNFRWRCIIIKKLFITLVILLTFSTLSLADPNPLTVSFIDVGQADSILIQTPSGNTMLIDAGNNDDADTIKAYLSKQNVKRLDIVIGTHPHEDHIGALDSIIDAYPLGKIHLPKVTNTTKTFKDVLLSVKAKGLKVSSPVPGSTLVFDPKVKVEVLTPNSPQYDDLNNYQIRRNAPGFIHGDIRSASGRDTTFKNFRFPVNYGTM